MVTLWDLVNFYYIILSNLKIINSSALVESLDLQNNCPKPDIIIADVTKDESKLKDLAQSTKVVISCVGPFRFFGEPIVKACAESGTNYVDINGETEFIEGIYAKYDQVAKKNGACIVSAAGFDSVPADLGCLFTKIQYSKNNAVATVSVNILFHLRAKPSTN